MCAGSIKLQSGIIELMAERKKCHTAMIGAVGTTSALYMALGLSTALFFGNSEGGLWIGMMDVRLTEWGQQSDHTLLVIL